MPFVKNMQHKRKILAICGNTLKDSSNLRLIKKISALTHDFWDCTIYTELADLPHFNPELAVTDSPEIILALHRSIAAADGVIICAPEYVFSLPASLKNLLEWCVSKTVFTEKPVGLITAAASGEMAHEQLQLILKTLGARFDHETLLLIKGIKAKIDVAGNITDTETEQKLKDFILGLKKLLKTTPA